MKREVIQTADGSKTIKIIGLDETYHSIHGALQEAIHVFIEAGLNELKSRASIRIFEMGFGTGLNAFLSALKASELNMKVEYHGIEAYPVSTDELDQLQYVGLVKEQDRTVYKKLHESKWGELVSISDSFQLKKIQSKLEETDLAADYFDIIYYDAFGPRAQEEMWSVELFQKMYDCLNKGGFLVTYCAKGQVKRNMKAVGFRVENLPGPPGKREMTRAWKD